MTAGLRTSKLVLQPLGLDGLKSHALALEYEGPS